MFTVVDTCWFSHIILLCDHICKSLSPICVHLDDCVGPASTYQNLSCVCHMEASASLQGTSCSHVSLLRSRCCHHR
ncbi:hypothetical protein DPMN_138906 [Dreissena polymorpha]|uniref:Uncharacterized protein n=1 Tax=Dreissena polymorpha TaxID=45954 RepID=A0A9D4G531_DREPO|nr:hypothetical protein DPMN_138906 [Dreissena polymorpha]